MFVFRSSTDRSVARDGCDAERDGIDTGVMSLELSALLVYVLVEAGIGMTADDENDWHWFIENCFASFDATVTVAERTAVAITFQSLVDTVQIGGRMNDAQLFTEFVREVLHGAVEHRKHGVAKTNAGTEAAAAAGAASGVEYATGLIRSLRFESTTATDLLHTIARRIMCFAAPAVTADGPDATNTSGSDAKSPPAPERSRFVVSGKSIAAAAVERIRFAAAIHRTRAHGFVARLVKASLHDAAFAVLREIKSTGSGPAVVAALADRSVQQRTTLAFTHLMNAFCVDSKVDSKDSKVAAGAGGSPFRESYADRVATNFGYFVGSHHQSRSSLIADSHVAPLSQFFNELTRHLKPCPSGSLFAAYAHSVLRDNDAITAPPSPSTANSSRTAAVATSSGSIAIAVAPVLPPVQQQPRVRHGADFPASVNDFTGWRHRMFIGFAYAFARAQTGREVVMADFVAAIRDALTGPVPPPLAAAANPSLVAAIDAVVERHNTCALSVQAAVNWLEDPNFCIGVAFVEPNSASEPLELVVCASKTVSLGAEAALRATAGALREVMRIRVVGFVPPSHLAFTDSARAAVASLAFPDPDPSSSTPGSSLPTVVTDRWNWKVTHELGKARESVQKARASGRILSDMCDAEVWFRTFSDSVSSSSRPDSGSSTPVPTDLEPDSPDANTGPPPLTPSPGSVFGTMTARTATASPISGQSAAGSDGGTTSPAPSAPSARALQWRQQRDSMTPHWPVLDQVLAGARFDPAENAVHTSIATFCCTRADQESTSSAEPDYYTIHDTSASAGAVADASAGAGAGTATSSGGGPRMCVSVAGYRLMQPCNLVCQLYAAPQAILRELLSWSTADNSKPAAAATEQTALFSNPSPADVKMKSDSKSDQPV